MDLIQDNIPILRDSINRQSLNDTTAIDVFTAFYVVMSKNLDSDIVSDKHFAFLLGCISSVPPGKERHFWFKKMFETFEKLLSVNPSDPKWLLLQANLIYLSPKC